MLCSLFYCFIYNIHITYHAFSVVQLTTLCSVSLPLQSIFESDSYLLFSSRVSIFCCTFILGLGLHDFCLLIEASDHSLKCHALGNSSSLNGVEMYHPCCFFFLFPYPDCTLFSSLFPPFAFLWDFCIYLLPGIPSVRLFPPPSALLLPFLFSWKLLLFLTTVCFGQCCFVSGFCFFSWGVGRCK